MRAWPEATLRRLTRRCATHDRPSYPRIRQLEQDLGQPPTTPPESFVDAYADPLIIECGHTWCRTRRR